MKSRFLLLFVWIAAGLARGPLLCGAEGQVTPPGLFLNYQLPAPQPHFITRTAGASGSTSLVRAPNLLLQFATPPVMEGVRFKKIAYSYAGGTGTASFTLDPFGTYDYETFRQGWEISVSGDLTEVGEQAEFEQFAAILHDAGFPEDSVTLVPGNHDAYTSGASP